LTTLASFVFVAFVFGLLFESVVWICISLAGLFVLSPLLFLLVVGGGAAVFYFNNHR
jgi:hypothetical protein